MGHIHHVLLCGLKKEANAGTWYNMDEDQGHHTE